MLFATELVLCWEKFYTVVYSWHIVTCLLKDVPKFYRKWGFNSAFKSPKDLQTDMLSFSSIMCHLALSSHFTLSVLSLHFLSSQYYIAVIIHYFKTITSILVSVWSQGLRFM